METDQSRFQGILAQQDEELIGNLAEKIAKLLIAKNLKIATAESVTAGLIANRLTAVSGSSEYFIGGYVCYHNRAKVQQLGIPAKLIAEKGSVSAEVTRELAIEAKRRLNVDMAIAVTGFAGPSKARSERVGLVYVCIVSEKGENTHQFLFEGDRESIRDQAASAALGLLYFDVEGNIEE